jgi:ElaB/YqjD/DUF883 family membrane-anchored ribosome-binding protein
MPARAADDARDDDRGSNTLADDLERLREDIAGLKSTLSGLGKRGAAEARAAADAKLDELHDELERLAGGLHLRGEDTLAGLEQRVRDHPVTSLLTAFGIGLILSRLLDRR